MADVNQADSVECIVDGGCQIVAMSKAVCHNLALSYDPTIRLTMESANRAREKSLGLSRNVPFTIGPMTLYLQVHVLQSPAYNILLGRPFNVLTQSVIRNFANADQTITIQDLNTGQVAIIPMIPQGKLKHFLK